MSQRNRAASVRARLLNHARESGQDFNLVLTRYALERLLYRLSISAHAGQFLLKGALLFDLWFDIPHRPTRDADFLGFGPADIPQLKSIFEDVVAIDADDGVDFRPGTVKADEIRKEANYAGIRVTLLALIDGARVSIQLDIGFGDAVTPGPEEVDYPVLLSGFDAPRLRVYPRDTVVAEKLEALTALGIANSRLKDYFDLWILAGHTPFDGDTLRRAIQATFERRRTPFPSDALPFGLTDDFATDALKVRQWRAFLKRNALDALELETVVAQLRNFLAPALKAASHGTTYPAHWPSGGPWTASGT